MDGSRLRAARYRNMFGLCWALQAGWRRWMLVGKGGETPGSIGQA